MARLSSGTPAPGEPFIVGLPRNLVVRERYRERQAIHPSRPLAAVVAKGSLV